MERSHRRPLLRAELNRTPTIIEQVDGRSSSPAGIGEPNRIEPGRGC